MSNVIGLLVLGFYGFLFIGAIVLLIVVIDKRIKEKKIEKEKHKDYKDY